MMAGPQFGETSRALHMFACVTAVATFLLIIAGGHVTSTGSGLSVPDWPLSFGTLMPEMKGGVVYEHSHRLIAGGVAILILALMVWLALREKRRWVRALGLVAFGAVLMQALLGGLTVLFKLPMPISAAHATLGQSILCLTVVIAMATSPRWAKGAATATRSAGRVGAGVSGSTPGGSAADVRRSTSNDAAWPAGAGAAAIDLPGGGPVASSQARARSLAGPSSRRSLAKLAVLAAVAVYIQLMIGAVMRHMDAGLAIPDFPLAFGMLIPPQWSNRIAVHFTHRLWALVVLGVIAALAVWLLRDRERRFPGVGAALGVLVTVQIALGALTVLSGKQVIIATAHVATGAAILALCVSLAVLLWRPIVEVRHAQGGPAKLAA